MKILLQRCLLALAIFSTGCATPYYGYSKAEWNKLPKADQQTIQADSSEIIHYKYRQQHEDLIDERKQQVIRRGVKYE